jgi:hypothetical protein
MIDHPVVHGLRPEATICRQEMLTFVQWRHADGATRTEVDGRMTVTEDDRDRLEAALVQRLPRLLGEVSVGLSEGWPDYARFLRSDPDGLAEAAALFVHRLVELAEPTVRPEVPHGYGRGDETIHLVFEQIGRQQMLAGNDLTRLLTAFQLGARVAWRHVAGAALDLGLAPDILASLADSVFVFINQLSYSSARGYLQAQLDDSRVRERHREELAQLLVSGRVRPESVRAAAVRAGWTLPERASVVLVDPDDEAARQVVDRLGGACLPLRQPDLHGAIVPDTHTAYGRSHLVRELRGAYAAVGYAAPPERLPRTLEVTRVVAELRRAGIVSGDPVFADEHLDTVIVWRDPALTEALRQQVLAPLDDVAPGARDRLVQTLGAWLRHHGDRRAMAEELSIHPQTVRYRMAQVRDLFGDALDSPRERARLFLALAWPVRATSE